jgi:large subunit ribosomal protein L23
MKDMPVMHPNQNSRSQALSLLVRPIVSEKAMSLAALNQYVFEVAKRANKIQLAQAFELAFPGRRVVAVRTVKVPSYTKRFGKRHGRTQERKKAVFSIQGEPLELFTGV